MHEETNKLFKVLQLIYGDDETLTMEEIDERIEDFKDIFVDTTWEDYLNSDLQLAEI